ncbi:MAG TPA: hypothetical protein VMB21_03200 [Candidatus Limnocylindria bacterium]|nr:hypothetical protein [Candidatus Limnocylindria bacterium]
MIALLALMAFAACGQNLITNPGFESGATGYTTDYTVDTTPTGQGQAGVRGSGTSGTGSSSVFNSGSTSLTAHGGSKFFAVNGSTSGTAIVWEQTVSSLVISGLTGSTFTFSFWIAAGDAASTTPSGQRPTIAVIINGTSIGNVTPSTTDGAWTQFTGTWTRGTNTTADIKLIDLKTASTGNDFILDDFVLVPEPSTYAAGVFLVGAGYFAWRKARRKSAAQEIAVR